MDFKADPHSLFELMVFEYCSDYPVIARGSGIANWGVQFEHILPINLAGEEHSFISIVKAFAGGNKVLS